MALGRSAWMLCFTEVILLAPTGTCVWRSYCSGSRVFGVTAPEDVLDSGVTALVVVVDVVC